MKANYGVGAVMEEYIFHVCLNPPLAQSTCGINSVIATTPSHCHKLGSGKRVAKSGKLVHMEYGRLTSSVKVQIEQNNSMTGLVWKSHNKYLTMYSNLNSERLLKRFWKTELNLKVVIVFSCYFLLFENRRNQKPIESSE